MSEEEVLVLYTFRGQDGETVPRDVQILILCHGVEELPARLCKNRTRLREVIIHRGLKRIGDRCFEFCENLLEIRISTTVRFIGNYAFRGCSRLKKIEFEGAATSLSHAHQLEEIGEEAFNGCRSLARIKFPSSPISVGSSAFETCRRLIEANLSRTRFTKISTFTFYLCTSLLTMSLPKTVEQIDYCAFSGCSELVTVAVSLDSQSIRVGSLSFFGCASLANFALPKGSTAETTAFSRCTLLHERYGVDASGIVAGLMRRFDVLLVPGMCYHQHSGITAPEFRECIEWANEVTEYPSVDNFGMTPLHILCSVSEPRLELLEVLLERYPYQMLQRKDATGKRALDYLIQNWTNGTASLVRVALMKCVLDPLLRWGATNLVETMETKAGALLFKDDKLQRVTLFNEVYSTFEKYKKMGSTSMLELALWKHKSGELGNGVLSKSEESLRLCGSGVVIPNVAAFLWGVTSTDTW